jgi:predicted alpha/beta-hydrolase family hydrolase
MPSPKNLHFAVENSGEVSAIFQRPSKPTHLLLLAHGAGAGMTHPFLESLADELAAAKIATFRYQFPYMEQGRRAPDRPPTLTATVNAAVSAAHKTAPNLPLIAGGKSMGGRMTSTAASQHPLENVRGMVFFGFPLHPPNQPGTKRADHLARVTIPMLFLQGTRDPLADLTLLRPVVNQLGSQAELHILESADHSFHVLKSSGKTDPEILRELAQTTATWAARVA